MENFPRDSFLVCKMEGQEFDYEKVRCAIRAEIAWLVEWGFVRYFPAWQCERGVFFIPDTPLFGGHVSQQVIYDENNSQCPPKDKREIAECLREYREFEAEAFKDPLAYVEKLDYWADHTEDMEGHELATGFLREWLDSEECFLEASADVLEHVEEVYLERKRDDEDYWQYTLSKRREAKRLGITDMDLLVKELKEAREARESGEMKPRKNFRTWRDRNNLEVIDSLADEVLVMDTSENPTAEPIQILTMEPPATDITPPAVATGEPVNEFRADDECVADLKRRRIAMRDDGYMPAAISRWERENFKNRLRDGWFLPLKEREYSVKPDAISKMLKALDGAESDE